MSGSGWTCATVTSINDVSAAAWDDLLREDDDANPFLAHAFLSSLEDSGCVGGRTGWHPAHQILRDGRGTVIGAAPAYVKTHSQGEYVFDHAWAEALERAGQSYYPKIQVSVPFTPVTGSRLLGSCANAAVAPALVAGLEALRARIDASSTHLTFLPEREARAIEPSGYMLRAGVQYHWRNEGHDTFEAFLSALASRKRKAIRRERKEALAPGIDIDWLSGPAITESHWDAFFAFYMDTGSRKWGRPYLNRRFFSLLGERMGDKILLVMARRNGRYIAGAINLIGQSRLFGRNWGAIEEHPFLHFEVCYYQAIDFAIAHGLDWVEAGAQGEHKLARGYRPVTTWSAHHIEHEGLRDAVARFLSREKSHILEEKNTLDMVGPYRRT